METEKEILDVDSLLRKVQELKKQVDFNKDLLMRVFKEWGPEFGPIGNTEPNELYITLKSILNANN